MAWSTREVAELAGTTVAAVRHYHRLGLLDEPQRTSNSYKQYDVRHLVRLLRIRRLVALGVPLTQIGTLDSEGDKTPAALRTLDQDLVGIIEHAQQARADIAKLLSENAPADTPQGFESVASRLSETDSSLLHIYRQLYDDQAMRDLQQIIEHDMSPVSREIDTVTADTDEHTQQRLAESLAPILAQIIIDYPWLKDPTSHWTGSVKLTEQTLIEALIELYNPTQRDVLHRASILAQKQLGVKADDVGSRFRPRP